MKKIIFLMLLFMNIAHIQACVRGDLGDPKEVLKKSMSLATSLPYAATVGMITNRKEMASCVALDPFHVLTAAHPRFLHGNQPTPIIFTNYHTVGFKGSNTTHSQESSHRSLVVGVSVHPEFRFLDLVARGFDSSIIEEYTESMQHVDSALCSHHFQGPDLAVLTLAKPIQGITFPKIYSGNYDEIQAQYGVSFGYGPPKINMEDGAIPVELGVNGVRLYKRHVTSNMVSFNSSNRVLHANYMTRWGCGDESFVVTEGMRKTEGVPVTGDSGGAFFLEVGAERNLQLAGITSCTMTYLPDVLTPEQRQILSDMPPTPLYPIWTAVGPHIDWIKAQCKAV